MARHRVHNMYVICFNNFCPGEVQLVTKPKCYYYICGYDHKHYNKYYESVLVTRYNGDMNLTVHWCEGSAKRKTTGPPEINRFALNHKSLKHGSIVEHWLAHVGALFHASTAEALVQLNARPDMKQSIAWSEFPPSP